MCDTCGCDQNQKIIQMEHDLLQENTELAMRNRDYFSNRHICTFNLMSSPGSGKTTLLLKTIAKLKPKHDITVIEGDQQTDRDAEKLRKQGLSTVQINTGKACHLDANSVFDALNYLHLHDHSVLFIENVGNLVCPAAFDLGERFKVVILSVTEGDDKPLKYPYMFHTADVLLVNKIDLLPYVDFNVTKCIEYANRVNPNIRVFQLSAQTEEGLDVWCQWIHDQRGSV